jgi:hypothetical protein
MIGQIPSEIRVYSGVDGQAVSTTTGLDGLVVGNDNPLIVFMKSILARGNRRYPHPDDIFMEDFWKADIGKGLAGLVHLVDVRSETPQGYKFETCGVRAAFRGTDDFSARFVNEIPTEFIRDLALESYHMAKSLGVPIVSEISANDLSFSSSYRRLILPLSHNGSDISHLLVAILRHSFQVH